MSEFEEKSDPSQQEPQEQPEHPYTPRPKWQIILAWVLFGIMVVGILLYYYWIAYPYA